MPPVPRRWLWRGLLAAVVVVVIAGGAVAFVLAHTPGNVSHPDLQFTAPTTSTAPAPKPHASKKQVNNFQWPLYGLTGGRTRVFAAPGNLAPPLHVGWKFTDGALLEFPPVIYHETMFVLDDDCAARAINLNNGHVRWFRKIGTLCAASPAIAPKAGRNGLVVMPVMSIAGHSPGNGRFAALSMKTGHIAWSRPVGAGTETSPLVHGITVYYGDGGGTLYARNVANGHLYWTYHASGAIKGGPALSGGNLYFGDYAGRAYAVNSVSGRQVWAVGTSGTQFGFGSGNFYATPAVAFGRVYMGNTDGRVYSFGARNGALAWATATGAYVYASAAVADPKGLGPTVYVGSYDGNLYAFNAQSGAVRWKHQVGGRISGSSTVIGNVVYFSNLGNKSTVGLDAISGRTVFSFGDGAFTPIIADYHSLYLDGYAAIYQLLPGRRPHHRAARHHAKAKRKRAAHHAARHAKAKKHAAHRAARKAKAHTKAKKKHAARKVRHAAKKKAKSKHKK
ncbi:MAG TPA: PQQ-binding-like beta-propeller repeat protein [Solirubrobacteraceae bacterium]|nr:PQQ-binding-like beta-propeller repeat protein [Solirubrobacteraceae bacterium]